MTRKREDLSACEKLIPKKVDQLTKTSIYLDCNIKRGPVAMACIINKNINLMGMLTFVHTTVDIDNETRRQITIHGDTEVKNIKIHTSKFPVLPIAILPPCFYFQCQWRF